MESERITQVTEKLGLTRQIVGVRFLTYKKEYEECIAQVPKGKMRLCGFVNQANHGTKYKLRLENFACPSGPNQTGMSETFEWDLTGQGQKHCGLYSDLSNGREAAEWFSQIPQKIYGLEVGPLIQMDEADVVIILGQAEQIMYVLRGYSWHYGSPKNFMTVGNVAMCSDMVAKPFLRNDIHLSLMCYGARIGTQSDPGEVGVGMPSHMFPLTAEGILKTLN